MKIQFVNHISLEFKQMYDLKIMIILYDLN